MSATPVLAVDSLHVAYGGVRAVRDVSLEVHPGESVAVLGANGAGKTSLLRAVSRLVEYEGSVTVAGEPTDGLRPEQVARLGVAHVPDHRGIFDDLTVRENLTAALYGASRTAAADDALARVHDLFPILEERAEQAAGTMSGGQQQMLTIARALVQDPAVVLIDEMSMGLAPSIVEDLFATVERLTSEGLGVVLVEQFVDQALSVVDRAVVLSGGQVVAAGTAEQVAADDVAAHYLGGTDDEDEPMPELATAELPDSESVPVDLNARELRALQSVAAAQDRTVTDLLRDAVRRDLFDAVPAADREFAGAGRHAESVDDEEHQP